MCKKTVECPKCIGNKKINAFNHIASGVCFQCNGSGTIQIDSTFRNVAATATEKKQLAWIVNATPAQWAKLTYAQIEKARSLAKSEIAIRADVVWPSIAEDAFQSMQNQQYQMSC
jgi:hypothetical protein